MIEHRPEDGFAVALAHYQGLPARLDAVRPRWSRPLTLTEKVLLAHWHGPMDVLPVRGETTVMLAPDRVAMQDATAQMALLQFISAGQRTSRVPATIHCDHLIRAKSGARPDLAVAEQSNHEVYEFLASAAAKYGLGFWKPGSGIIHQVLLEHYAFPGGLMIGTDSHTPNAGGLGMLAIGVGGADAVDAMVGLGWEVVWPRLVGVHLTGRLSGWTSGKDVILKLAGLLTVSGGTGKVIEYFGAGAATLSATAKATITNMGAELGATTSIFPYDASMRRYLEATGRHIVAEGAERVREHLVADPEIAQDPVRYYDEVLEIDLDRLEPHMVGPHTPDRSRPLSEVAREAQAGAFPAELSAALIGSCTNSSYEDIGRAADVARKARAAGLKARIPLLVTPGSEQVRATIERDGLLDDLVAIGACVLANACGPCIGQWERPGVSKGTANSILTSYNRNFPRRNDGNPATHAFIASPEVVVAYALTGSLATNPLESILQDGQGPVALAPPVADELPRNGFIGGAEGYRSPSDHPETMNILIQSGSERLSLLEPFAPADAARFRDLPLLMKAVGKCTTDHISPAGPWLKYRGHLDRISDNLFSGVQNAFARTPGTGCNVFTGDREVALAALARDYKGRGQGWVAVGDTNYGEGSSREHAAMSPRYLGCLVVLVRSFARIHETNLKKQGVLPLVFAVAADYDRLQALDRLSLPDIASLAPGRPVRISVHRRGEAPFDLVARHSLTAEQIEWFWAGSALNRIRAGRTAA
ncbi:MAG: aconitate hydratase [Acidiferrobacteraceae bacterium]